MKHLTEAPATIIGDEELRRFVERSLLEHGGFAGGITRIYRKLGDYHSSFAIEDLQVESDEGTQLSLVFKNVSPNALLEYARQIRPHFSYDARREVDVYRTILPGSGLGTAACFGAVIDQKRERYWLLLEKASGIPLAKVGEFAIWCDVARWLANMHCALAEVANCHHRFTSLLKYDEHFFNIWIDRAERFSKLRSSVNCNDMPGTVEVLADKCRLAVRQIDRLPPAFIHGEFYASNVLIDNDSDKTRICPIDWEMAAIGPALLDLAALVAGNWPEELRTEMAMAYYDSLSHPFNYYGNVESFFQALRCCRLFLAIKWLGWSSNWQAPDEHRCDWFAEAAELAPTIESL